MYKQVLHDHLDGGLRPSTAKELAMKSTMLQIFLTDQLRLL